MAHKMIKVGVTNDGFGEWECPICGRRFLLKFYPYRKELIEVGDCYAGHIGGYEGNDVELNLGDLLVE